MHKEIKLKEMITGLLILGIKACVADFLHNIINNDLLSAV